MDLILEQALSFRSVIVDEIARIDRYLEAHDEMFGTSYSGNASKQRLSHGKRRYRSGQQKRVVERSIEILKAIEEPMARIDIADQLVKEGVLVCAGSPHRYVGTTFNRHRDIFQRVGDGMWTLVQIDDTD